MPSEALRKLFDACRNSAAKVFEATGEMPGCFTIEFPSGRIRSVPVIWGSSEEKHIKLAMARALFQGAGIVRLVYTTEMWFLPVVPKPGERVDFDNAPIPSESRDRQEALMVIAEERGDPSTLAAMAIITRDASGKPTLGKWDASGEFMSAPHMAAMLGAGGMLN